MATPLARLNVLSPKIAKSVSPRFGKNLDIHGLNTPNKKYVRRLQFLSPSNAIPAESLETKSNIVSNGKNAASSAPFNFSENTKTRNKELLDINSTPRRAKVFNYGLKNKSILHILGAGAFGTVVKGTYKGQTVAVKIVRKRDSGRDLNALNLNHKNVTKVLAVLSGDNEAYEMIIMEYQAGSLSLQTVLDDISFDLGYNKMLKMAVDISNGLLYCHNSGVLHLDVKPNNVLVCEHGVCKLCDFGSSLKAKDEHDCSYRGTPRYSAPEILQGGKPTAKSDVYSLGILLWQLRYRKPPYNNINNNEILIYKVVKFNIRPSSELSLQDEYYLIYNSCWQSKAEDRPNIETVANKLISLL